jgi:2-polyprenyl-6-methoxyphenol hydroxylase-like FAD-dependent oxidoreductase|tara:strand:- start:7118 stop:8263 length:1146 start_codon:yes stop_codon:yes gene_type:complete
MNTQKICIIGDGLTGLTTAAILGKQNINIDLYSYNKKKSKNLDNRTTAISESNFQYIKNNLNLHKTNFFWPCKKIYLFFEDKGKIINFLNFDDYNKNLMHIFQNKNLKQKLDKIISQKKNIKVINKKIKDINCERSFVTIDKKKIFYDLIILSIGGLSKLYAKIDAGRSINKKYNEVAITAIIKHNAKVKNASQFFLKEGPLAILPFKKNIFSTVWSINNHYFRDNKENLKNILTKKLETVLNIKKIKTSESIKIFPINLNLKTKYFKKNVLILGDGLHTVHPMAGQGFNLVLRDIKKLAELMSQTSKLGLLFKDSFLLKNFRNTRKPENNLFGLGINLTNFFFRDSKYLSVIKKKLFQNINNFSFIKKISQSVADRGISF